MSAARVQPRPCACSVSCKSATLTPVLAVSAARVQPSPSCLQQATADVLHKVSFHPSNTNILVVYLVVAFLQGNYTPIPIRLKQRLTTLDLRHFVWNIGERLGTKNGYNGYARADFIKAMFPDVMKDIEQDSIRNFKFQPNKGSIVIDEPDEDDFRFHIK